MANFQLRLKFTPRLVSTQLSEQTPDIANWELAARVSTRALFSVCAVLRVSRSKRPWKLKGKGQREKKQNIKKFE